LFMQDNRIGDKKRSGISLFLYKNQLQKLRHLIIFMILFTMINI
jgi:hypothetical protein